MKHYLLFVEIAVHLEDKPDPDFKILDPVLISAPTEEEALALVPNYMPDKMHRSMWGQWLWHCLDDVQHLCKVRWLELTSADEHGSVHIPLGGDKDDCKSLNHLIPPSKGYLARVKAWGRYKSSGYDDCYATPNPDDLLDVGYCD